MNLTRRELRGAGIAYVGSQIRRENDRLFIVNSQSGTGEYRVEWLGPRERWACDCADYLGHSPAKDHFVCKHQAAVNWTLAAPLVLLANAPAAAGDGYNDPEPFITYRHQPSSIHDLIEVYRTTLLSLSYLPDALRRPPRPRLTRRSASLSQ